MKRMLNSMLVACLTMSLVLNAVPAFAQEANKSASTMMVGAHPLAKEAMDMKKAKEMASPAMMQKAKEQMMEGDAMHMSMAMETTMAMTLKDDKTMKMVKEQVMAPAPDNKQAISDEQIKAAIRKVFSDPKQFQSMLQTLVMRESASNMMMTKPGVVSMAIPEADLKAAKMGMMADETMTMKVAKEMMMNAMMMDKDISNAVKQAAMKSNDPAMERMMKSASMMMANEKMQKEPAMKMEVAKEAMAREMAKPPVMMSGNKN